MAPDDDDDHEGYIAGSREDLHSSVAAQIPKINSIFRDWYVLLTHSSRSVNDRWGIKDDRATTFLHSSLSSAFRRASHNPGQQLFSIPPCPHPFEGLHLTPILSILICYLLISFSVCLSFSLLVQCPEGSSLQVL